MLESEPVERIDFKVARLPPPRRAFYSGGFEIVDFLRPQANGRPRELSLLQREAESVAPGDDGRPSPWHPCDRLKED
jgi:hypothetical protein